MQLGLSFSLVFIFGIFQCHGTGHSYGAFFVKSLLFVHKLSNFIVLTKHSQTPASLFLAWRFDLYPKVFLKGYERRSKVRQLCTTSQLFWVCPRVSKRQAKNKLAGVSSSSRISGRGSGVLNPLEFLRMTITCVTRQMTEDLICC